MTKFSKILLRAVGEIPQKQLVFATVLREINCPLTGLRQVKNGYLAYMEREADLDKLLSGKAQSELKKIGIETKIPPKIRCQRSLICRQIDSYVGEHSANELLEEINKQNKNKAIEIIKFKQYTHVFKVEFQSTEMALSAKRNGLLCFNTRITPDQMEQERHTDVLMCFTCYQIEDHIKANCPTPQKVICSECAGNHFHTDCNNETTKKCINCGGNHRTMAMSCPIKKEAIKRKREEEDRRKKEKEELPLSKIVQKTAQEIGKKTEERVMSSVLGEAGLRALIMIMDAHVHNIIEPGSYNSRLNKTLQENNIEPIKLPKEQIQSEKLMQTQIITEKLKEQYDNQKTESPKRKKSRGQEMEREMRSVREEEEQDEEEMDMEDMPDLEDITEDEAILDMHLNRVDTPADASFYKIKIITHLSNLNNQSPKQVKELYQQGKIKYNRSKKTKISNKIIEELILANKMGCTSSCVTQVSKARYKEVRNGQTIDSK